MPLSRHLPVRFFVAVCCSALLLGLGSCSSSRGLTAKPSVTSGSTSSAKPSRPSPKPERITIPSNPGQAKVVAEAQTWLGVPYKYGGNDRNGVDCSGLVAQVFLGSSAIQLPRTSRTQREATPDLKRDELVAGDLVFFDTSSNRAGEVNHVGVYVGDGKMIHASTSKGVIVSDIDGVFYGDRFLGGGRVLALQASEPASQPKPAKVSAPLPVASPKAIAAPQGAPAATPVPAVAPKPTPVSKPAAADPRNAVLNSLIEQKLDSIYASR